jgi:hypothetical protein
VASDMPGRECAKAQRRWLGGRGLRQGLNLQQVEAQNKGPFKVSDFDTDAAGLVSSTSQSKRYFGTAKHALTVGAGMTVR